MLVLSGIAAVVGVFACSVEVPPPGASDGGDSSAPAGPGPASSPDAFEPTGDGESPEPASTEDDEEVEAENGQTGSLSPSECLNDWDCTPVLENWRPGDVEYVLLDSACEHLHRDQSPTIGTPGCVCLVRETRRVRVPGSPEVSRQTSEYVFDLDADPRGVTIDPECYVRGSIPGAPLYGAAAFPGCSVDSLVNDCAAPCADAVARQQAAAQVEHDVEVRMARCDYSGCQTVLRVDDACYNHHGARASCELSDAEIVAVQDRVNPSDQCARPAAPCESAADCPSGLGCNGRFCGACRKSEEVCTLDETGQCSDGGPFSCGEGEACHTGVCFPAEQAECLRVGDCPTTDPAGDPRTCLLSGIDHEEGRGTLETRSYCASRDPNPFGGRVGDVLEVRVVGPVDAVGASFDPPISPMTNACGERLGLTVGAALRLRIVEAPAGAVLIDPEAPLDPVASAHPRDPAEGRRLDSLSGSPGNSAALARVNVEPFTLDGCLGRREIRVESLLQRRQPGVSLPDGGTFPTSVLSYRFHIGEEGYDSPACAEMRPLGCWDRVQVEVTRLTP